ncbi:MAG TPA: DUF167 family protein [Acetobacteraceae bacterium]|nr:DUF167 family protein [Acetobacteraceae bacterium]
MSGRKADRQERCAGRGRVAAPAHDSLPSCSEASADGLRIAVKLRPGARHTGFLGIEPSAPAPGWPAARLSLAVTAPAEAGRANKAAIAALAAVLEVTPDAVALRAGKASRNKLFSIAGDPGSLALRLSRLIAGVKSPRA